MRENQAGPAHKPARLCPVGGVAPLDTGVLCSKRRLANYRENQGEMSMGENLRPDRPRFGQPMNICRRCRTFSNSVAVYRT